LRNYRHISIRVFSTSDASHKVGFCVVTRYDRYMYISIFWSLQTHKIFNSWHWAWSGEAWLQGASYIDEMRSRHVGVPADTRYFVHSWPCFQICKFKGTISCSKNHLLHWVKHQREREREREVCSLVFTGYLGTAKNSCSSRRHRYTCILLHEHALT
jgi:hypothetical protein